MNPQEATTAARRPSRSWTALALVVSVAAIAATMGALIINERAQQPIGEGELFLLDGRRASATLGNGQISTDDLRRLRNDLTIEAVSLIEPDGLIGASTSPNLEGKAPASSLMAGFANTGRFGAIAVPVADPISIDGIVEWQQGEIVYEVVQPLGDGRAVLLTYDVSELLARRSSAGGVPAATVQLLGLAAILLMVVIFLFVGRGRAARTFRDFAVESDFLQRESAALHVHNEQLDAARQEAERAFELAEEKNRIRSEFVLMINHELRTPLTGVVTGAELLRGSGAVTDETWAAILDDVLTDGRRLAEMIDQILAVARIENGALFFELHPITMSALFDRLVEMHPRFSVDHASTLLLQPRTDSTTVVNLVQSLADNAFTHGAQTVAVRAADRQPFDPMLEVGVRPEPAVFLVVNDDGPGIDPGFLPRSFEKFEKDSRSSGTGLGLYIARMMADALQGSILVTTSDTGTSFAIALPATAGEGAAA